MSNADADADADADAAGQRVSRERDGGPDERRCDTVWWRGFVRVSREVMVACRSLCRETVEDYSIGYPYQFANPGWYMFVLNQTYIQPTIVRHDDWPD
jgi:hypothetical protein